MESRYYFLSQQELPNEWYNIQADLPENLPNSVETDTTKVEIMNRIRVQELNRHEEGKERYIPIPDEVKEKYIQIGRPTPLMRARELEKYLDTQAEIYIKREDYMPTHSFKINSAIAQAYYAKKENFKGVVSETGAGQWGLALAYAASLYGLNVNFFWVKVSKEQKPLRADWSNLFGANIIKSPSIYTNTGRKILEEDKECPGSLGIAIGEAIEYAKEHPEYAYVSGSNLSYVLLHQSINGLELKKQLKNIGVKPDAFVACCGGGSNLGGFMGPFLFDDEFSDAKFLAAESDDAPRLTKGEYRFDYADPYGNTPLVKSYTLGHDFVPPSNHVGGLRQHNGSPIVGMLRHKGFLDAVALSQTRVLQAGRLFSQLYGTLPAPESSHALCAAIDLALEAKRNNKTTKIVVCMSGCGVLDMSAYNTLLNK